MESGPVCLTLPFSCAKLAAAAHGFVKDGVDAMHPRVNADADVTTEPSAK